MNNTIINNDNYLYFKMERFAWTAHVRSPLPLRYILVDMSKLIDID